MNSKGFATTGIIFAVLLTSMLIMAVFFNSILNTSFNVQNSKELVPNYINNMNGIERVYSVFKENISHNKDIAFEDIDKKYKVVKITEDYSDVNRNLNNLDTFYVNNKTNIKISFEVYPIDSEKAHSYSVDIRLDGYGNVISSDSMTKNSVIDIDENFLYNQETGKTNYGEYEVNVDTTNCSVVIKVEYKRLDYREVEISNENIKQILAIENSPNGDTAIHFIQ